MTQNVLPIYISFGIKIHLVVGFPFNARPSNNPFNHMFL